MHIYCLHTCKRVNDIYICRYRRGKKPGVLGGRSKNWGPVFATDSSYHTARYRRTDVGYIFFFLKKKFCFAVPSICYVEAGDEGTVLLGATVQG